MHVSAVFNMLNYINILMKIVTYNNSFHFSFSFAIKTRYFHMEHNTLRTTNYREEKCFKEFLFGVLTVKTLRKMQIIVSLEKNLCPAFDL